MALLLILCVKFYLRWERLENSQQREAQAVERVHEAQQQQVVAQLEEAQKQVAQTAVTINHVYLYHGPTHTQFMATSGQRLVAVDATFQNVGKGTDLGAIAAVDGDNGQAMPGRAEIVPLTADGRAVAPAAQWPQSLQSFRCLLLCPSAVFARSVKLKYWNSILTPDAEPIDIAMPLPIRPSDGDVLASLDQTNMANLNK